MNKQSKILVENYLMRGPDWCANRLGITYRACVLRAHRLGLGSRRAAKRKQIEVYIRANYAHKAAKACAEEIGVSVQHVRQVALSLGLTGRRKKTRYSTRVRADFFDLWTAESAYVLGFIYADGSLWLDKVSLYQNEESYLELLRGLMGVKNEIRSHGKRCHVLSFNCCHLADRLRKIGIRPRKSFGHMVFPESLPDDLYHHFVRGFFDGDGSVGVYGQWRNLRVSLYGQKDFIERIFTDVSRLVGIMGGGVRKATSKRADFFTCSWGAAEDTMKIFNWMYRDAGSLCLSRKWKIMNQYFTAIAING